jgi:hypothetical protein
MRALSIILFVLVASDALAKPIVHWPIKQGVFGSDGCMSKDMKTFISAYHLDKPSETFFVPDAEKEFGLNCTVKNSDLKEMTYSGRSKCVAGNWGESYGNYDFEYKIISNTEFLSKGKAYKWCFDNTADKLDAQQPQR